MVPPAMFPQRFCPVRSSPRLWWWCYRCGSWRPGGLIPVCSSSPHGVLDRRFCWSRQHHQQQAASGPKLSSLLFKKSTHTHTHTKKIWGEKNAKQKSQIFQSAGQELCCSLVCCFFCNMSVHVLFSSSVCCCFLLGFLFHTDIVLSPLWRCIYFIALWYAMLLRQKSIIVNVTCTVSFFSFAMWFSVVIRLYCDGGHTHIHKHTDTHSHTPANACNFGKCSTDALQSSCHKYIFLNELPNYCKDCVKLYYVKKEQNGLYTSAFYEKSICCKI